MSKWYITGLAPVYHREVELILRLFFTQGKLVEEQRDCDGHLHFAFQQRDSHLTVEVTCDWLTQSVKTKGHDQCFLSTTWTEKEQRKKSKQSISRALLQAFEKLTSIRQPWGILTGVRPTKLYHRFLQDGMSPAAIHQQLEQAFRLVPDKIDLLQEIVTRQHAALPDLYQLREAVSLYIGIPFCPTKCAYCTFPAYAIQGRNGSVEAFLAGLHEEIRSIGRWLEEQERQVTTIYWGGGTPTSISADQMDALFHTLMESIPGYQQVREVTVEAGRPDTLEAAKLEVMQQWHVDRISINPQSFRQQTLKTIGRHHTVEETLEAFDRARKMGFANINMDLIIGLPDEGVDVFRQSLQEVKRLHPESITVHTLSFKRGSTMTQKRDAYEVAERDEVAEMVRLARNWTAEHRYHPYYLYRQKNILGNQENVGYSLEGKESLYNIIIMEELQTIIGLGCGAVSKLVSPTHQRIKRYANPKEPKAYIDTYPKHIENKLQALTELYARQEN